MARFKVREQVGVLSAVTTGNGAFPLNDATLSEHYVNWSTGVSSGSVIIEVSNSSGGPWDVRQTITAPGTVPALNAYKLDEPVAWARHRVGATVVGGTVTTNHDAWM